MIQSLYAASCPQVTVEGLEIMNDDPSEVDVLYAKVIHPVWFKFFPCFKSDFAPSVLGTQVPYLPSSVADS